MEMNENIYSKEFTEALKFCNQNNLYLGEGNPNAKILIIGQECALDEKRLEEKGWIKPKQELTWQEKENLLTKNNTESWQSLYDRNIQLNQVEIKKKELKNKKEHVDINDFYPLFPHLGQRYGIRNWSKIKKEFIGKTGTSRTWYFYQQLIDLISHGKVKNNKEELIDFHKYCFHTELNQIPIPRSSTNRDKEYNRLRNESITKRAEFFNKMDFFTKFPIIIMSTGNYTRDFNFNIEEIFKVEWTKETKHIGKNWYNVHYQKEGSPRILIHTWQFSASISKELINAIAQECKEFI